MQLPPRIGGAGSHFVLEEEPQVELSAIQHSHTQRSGGTGVIDVVDQRISSSPDLPQPPKRSKPIASQSISQSSFFQAISKPPHKTVSSVHHQVSCSSHSE